MKGTVDTSKALSFSAPLWLIIGKESRSYTGDGNRNMDKAKTARLSYYSRNNEHLTIESFFIGDRPLSKIIKQFALEIQAQIIEVSNSTNNKYSINCNIEVADSTKEDGI